MSFDSIAAIGGVIGAGASVLVTLLEAKAQERASKQSLKSARQTIEESRPAPSTRDEAVQRARQAMTGMKDVALSDYAANSEVRKDVDDTLRDSATQLSRFPLPSEEMSQ